MALPPFDAWVAGVDGCPAGWLRVARRPATGDLQVDVLASAADLLEIPPVPAVLAIDVPIGLPEGRPRLCDRVARGVLGHPRSSSVFPAPPRPALAATSHEEACELAEAASGKRISIQTWSLLPKIREVDAWLREEPPARDVVREVHPEISFWAWSLGRPMEASKRTAEGRAERRRLLDGWLPDGYETARDGRLKKEVGDDDILDAFAGLFTAHLVWSGEARSLAGDDAPRDAEGLPMEILY